MLSEAAVVAVAAAAAVVVAICAGCVRGFVPRVKPRVGAVVVAARVGGAAVAAALP